MLSVYTTIAAVFGLALAAVGAAIGQGIAVASGLEGMARNPEASGEIRTSMILGLVLIEALVLYVLLVVLLLLYANPLFARITG